MKKLEEIALDIVIARLVRQPETPVWGKSFREIVHESFRAADEFLTTALEYQKSKKNQGDEPGLDFTTDHFFMTMAKLGVDADYIARMVDRRRTELGYAAQSHQ